MSEQRSRSPDTVQGSDRKRRRKVLSCYDCRRRKLLCDRGLPACGRCTKAGQAASCLYIEDATDLPGRDVRPSIPTDLTLGEDFRPTAPTAPPASAPDPVNNFTARLISQDKKIQLLESALSQTNCEHEWKSKQQIEGLYPQKTVQHLPDDPESIINKSSGPDLNDRETMVVRGKAFKTEFHGATRPDAAISHMPELHDFSSDAFQKFPALARIRCDIKALDDRHPPAGLMPPNLQDLYHLLPDREQSDQLVQLYIASWVHVYHILHLPSFLKEYDQMWIDLPNARPPFVALTLTLMAATSGLTSEGPELYTAASPAARDVAVGWIQAVDGWLLQECQRHVTCADFQIRILLLLAKQVNAHKLKSVWTEAGNLVRFGMSAGLHRDPSSLYKYTSMPDKEMRRRLWAVMAELDLQASIDRGMMSTAWEVQADCPAPSNIQDEDLDAESEQLPAAKPLSELTPSSFLHISHGTLNLRCRLNVILNDPKATLTFDHIRAYTEEIETHLTQLPMWTSEEGAVPRALLQLQLRQFLLLIHTQHARFSDSESARNYSKLIIMESAQRMIDIHSGLVKQKIYSLELLRNDVLRAGLAACWLAVIAGPKADDLLSRSIEQAAPPLAQAAVEMVNNKVERLGREQRQLWLAAAAYASMKSKADPDRRNEHIQEAMDTISRAYYKMMAGQESAQIPLPKASWTTAPPTMNGMTEYTLPVDQQKDVNAFGGDDRPFDLDDLLDWTFDDWAFDTVDFQQPFAIEMQP